MSIELKQVTHIYSQGSAFERKALDHINLRIEDGEFIALCGHTGCGKSTLVQHLNGLLQPTEGQVLVNGEDINGEHVNRRKLRQSVGLVFQYPEYQLFEETVANDIAFGPKNMGLDEAEIDQRVRRAMEHVHLDYQKYANSSPFDLSGGQMRRVAIAGVLAMEPSVLVLDEPTAGLDPRGRDRILGIVKDLHHEGATIIMVSHSMDDVASLATRMVVMVNGTIAKTGSCREIFMDHDLMKKAGLDIPSAARLCQELRSKGIHLPDDLYTQEELHEHIIRLWKEAKGC
ncbi:MAG: energy-coupling factor transporter ATPase [Clostridiales bacterium]|nr:energy-coupling factor transporter ATPase [Clostridiales bacterium]